MKYRANRRQQRRLAQRTGVAGALVPRSGVLAVRSSLLMLALGMCLPVAQAQSGGGNSRISQHSLVVKTPVVVEPNLMFTLDDSGSMSWNFLPDENVHALSINFHPQGPKHYVYRTDGVVPDTADSLVAVMRRSHINNKLYYNPEVRYLPWLDENSRPMADADPGAAYFHRGYRRRGESRDDPGIDTMRHDLRGRHRLGELTLCQTVVKNKDGKNTCSSNGSGVTEIAPATYFEFSVPGSPERTSNPSEADRNNLAHYKRVAIMDHMSFQRGENRTDCSPGSTAGVRVCTQAQEYQNFANWYQYHRTRMHVAIGAVGHAFSSLSKDVRVGYGVINQGRSTIDGVETEVIQRGVRRFEGNERVEFFRWLNNSLPLGYTPLVNATHMVGKYFERRDNNGPWSAEPGRNSPKKHLSCRRSFHLLMTDGAYNFKPDRPRTEFTLEADNVAGPLIHAPDGSSWQYRPDDRLYASAASGTLADYAMHYWNRDLRPDLKNDVPVKANNPAFWQNLSMYTLGFGVSGSLQWPDDLSRIQDGSKSWPVGPIKDQSSETIDDLWHAAVNGRGRYLNVTEGKGFLSSLAEILHEIQGFIGSTAGVAVNAQALQAGNQKYVPSFDTGSWSGNLVAYEVNENGQQGMQLWDSTTAMPKPEARRLFVGLGRGQGATSAPLRWDSGLPEALRNEMAGQAGIDRAQGSRLISYLRGDKAEEDSRFRARKGPIGHIVNSPPVYIGNPVNRGYHFLPATLGGQASGADSYQAYVKSKEAKAARPGVVFIGSNDGILHAFDAKTGKEVYGYIPRAVALDMARLSRPDAQPRFMMDGPLLESDAYLSGRWTNVLLGTSGAGPRSVFALNVSDTRSSDQGLGPRTVMWEIDERAQPEIGHVLAAPEVGVLRDGRWVAVLGNGYESQSRKAQLFVIDLSNGDVIARLDTGAGSMQNPNGLGGVRLMRDGNNVISAAYAGDLHGNVWKFDLASSRSDEWQVAFNRRPLFTARGPNGALPISAPPATVTHLAGGVMVLVGTGKLFEIGDDKDETRQALYGLWDNARLLKDAQGEWRWQNGSVIEASQIRERTVSISGEYASITGDLLDWNRDRGWRIPLTMIERLNDRHKGQRNIVQPQLVSGLALFETMTPVLSNEDEDNACVAQIKTPAFNVLVDPLSGVMPEDAVIDTNGDGRINAQDKVVGGWQVDDWTGRSVVLWEPPRKPKACTGSNCTQNARPDICPPGTLRNVLQNVGESVTLCVSVPAPSRWWWRELSVPDRSYSAGSSKPEDEDPAAGR